MLSCCCESFGVTAAGGDDAGAELGLTILPGSTINLPLGVAAGARLIPPSVPLDDTAAGLMLLLVVVMPFILVDVPPSDKTDVGGTIAGVGGLKVDLTGVLAAEGILLANCPVRGGDLAGAEDCTAFVVVDDIDGL